VVVVVVGEFYDFVVFGGFVCEVDCVYGGFGVVVDELYLLYGFDVFDDCFGE